MPAKKQKPTKPDTAPPKIHEAALAPGRSGAVFRGKEMSVDEAVARRKDGADVVVCGADAKANRALARQIEEGVGPSLRQWPHRRAGPAALPHFQPVTRPPQGHTFYETEHRKARRQP